MIFMHAVSSIRDTIIDMLFEIVGLNLIHNWIKRYINNGPEL